MHRIASTIAVATAMVMGTTALTHAQVTVDPTLPNYEAASGVSGSLTSIGSDTLNNQMALWAEGYAQFYPNVAIEIQGAGSGTAPPALIQGTAQFGPMSRAMSGSEIQEFEAQYGYVPTAIRGAIDALGVFVHIDNPIECLTLPQVDAIFSSTRNGGLDQAITTWGQLGLEGEWADRPIAMYGRNSASGTFGYFREVALFNGDYSPEVREQPGSSTVIQGVASDVAGIGYSGVGYATADVRAVPIAANEGGECYEPTGEHAAAGNYPIARFLYIYVNKDPNEALEPLRGEFIRYVYSQEGQNDVLRAGFFPVNKAIADADLTAFGLLD
ncbi:PstS family phosphate ABC transporter substrate-binding protein [Pelagibacterium lentulum]|uniref:Phosphate-binding protein n=1 Tax=Pelagibacterium lentulum TaxID=2029865 RepID=A0A916RKP8_9HYPH|nr:PstS family phosphate ABC transporter substrate-binding protein [Pelagibacterium lentulum]GGA57311.1 phosphate-binding protein PstS [Pelagibacterium lentulum]